MIRHQNDNGSVNISTSVYTDIAGNAATNCFGVKGMAARSVSDGLVHLLRREAMSKGVKVHFLDDGSISIDLHIAVDRGINTAAIGEAIIERVKYEVTKSTDTVVQSVNVYVDSISAE